MFEVRKSHTFAHDISWPVLFIVTVFRFSPGSAWAVLTACFQNQSVIKIIIVTIWWHNSWLNYTLFTLVADSTRLCIISNYQDLYRKINKRSSNKLTGWWAARCRHRANNIVCPGTCYIKTFFILFPIGILWPPWKFSPVPRSAPSWSGLLKRWENCTTMCAEKCSRWKIDLKFGGQIVEALLHGGNCRNG